ncbi:MAG: hypothetical protein FJ255_09150 [Phycisphaerae bacterium]|nr:hypothetical protein [Phycisphaerae bacterium]
MTAAALALAQTIPIAAGEPPRFVMIVDPAGAPDLTGVVHAISPDGRFVGGTYQRRLPQFRMEAFRWSEATGLDYLGVLPAQYPFSVVDGLSLNGEVAVGMASTCGDVAFMWRDGKMWELPRPPDARCSAGAWDITPDGRIAVGFVSLDPAGNGAAIWRDAKVQRLVSDLPDCPFSMAIVTTPDAGAIAGLGRNGALTYEAVLYRKGRLTRLGVLPGAPESGAYGVSDDGRIVAGVSFSQGFLWSERTGMVNMAPFAPPGTTDFNTFPISADGRIVGGMVRFQGRQQAAVWTAHTGTRLLMTILAEAGVDLQGITHILNADYMSADGLKYACRAWRLPEPLTRPYYAVIPPFCFADCDNSGDLDYADLLCFLNRFERAQDPRANPIDFFYCDFAPDDEIDFNDFLAFLNLYNKGCGQ